jgi:hypothetical protein
MANNITIAYLSTTNIGTWNNTNYNLCRVSDVVNNISSGFTPVDN